MPKRNIIVIGEPAEAPETIKAIDAVLPPDLDASVVVVPHSSSEIHDIFSHFLDRLASISNARAGDRSETAAKDRAEIRSMNEELRLRFDALEDASRKAESRANVSDQKHRMIVDSVRDYAIFTMDPDRVVTSWNHGAEKIFLWTEEEMLGITADIIFTPEDVAMDAPDQEAATAIAEGRAPDERFHMRKDGSRFYASGVMTPLRDESGIIQGFVKVARDMTERIEADKAINERETLKKLVAAQELERSRLARDLHDELGQQLTVMRLRLEKLIADDSQEGIKPTLEELGVMARSLDEGIDRITWELRPLVLEDLGLLAALQKYVNEWCEHWGIECDLIASSLKKQRFKPEVETNLYRIVQEALNNVAKHAKAKHVEIMFERRGEMLVLIIEDDGKGFNIKNKKLTERGLGLTGMRERAALIGGSVEIESKPKQGTTVFVKIPAAWALLKK